MFITFKKYKYRRNKHTRKLYLPIIIYYTLNNEIIENIIREKKTEIKTSKQKSV